MRQPDTEALLSGLDRYRSVRGTVELFDALLEEDVSAVSRELGRAPRHPLGEELRAWLGARGARAPRTPTNDEVLAAHGILDVDDWLADHDKRMHELEERLARASLGRQRAERSASAYAGVTVILLGVAVLGWLAALGVITIGAEKLPTVDDLDQPTQGGAAAPERRSR